MWTAKTNAASPLLGRMELFTVGAAMALNHCERERWDEREKQRVLAASPQRFATMAD